MKLIRFNLLAERPNLARLGAVLSGDGVVDLKAAYARYLNEQGEPLSYELSSLRMPGSVIAFLSGAEPARRALTDLTAWAERLRASDPAAEGLRGEPLFAPYVACRLHAPVRPTKLIVARFKPPGSGGSPVSFVSKPIGTVVGPTRNIIRPFSDATMQCAPGVAVVIGQTCSVIEERDVPKLVAGYTLMTDVSLSQDTTDVGAFALSMYPSFAPCGPWLSLSQEIPEIAQKTITGRINDKIYQEFSLGKLPWSVSHTISFLSRMGFEPGDTIWIGMESSASGQVKLNDVVSTELLGLGSLRNKIDLKQPPN